MSAASKKRWRAVKANREKENAAHRARRDPVSRLHENVRDSLRYTRSRADRDAENLY